LNVLKFNPILYHKIEGKSLLDRVYEEYIAYETSIKELFFKQFSKEQKLIGVEKVCYNKVSSLPEIKKDAEINIYAECNSNSKILAEFVRSSKLIDKQNMVSNFTQDLELVFKEIIYLLNSRYKVESFLEDENQYEKSEQLVNNDSRKTSFNGVILVDS